MAVYTHISAFISASVFPLCVTSTVTTPFASEPERINSWETWGGLPLPTDPSWLASKVQKMMIVKLMVHISSLFKAVDWSELLFCTFDATAPSWLRLFLDGASSAAGVVESVGRLRTTYTFFLVWVPCCNSNVAFVFDSELPTPDGARILHWDKVCQLHVLFAAFDWDRLTVLDAAPFQDSSLVLLQELSFMLPGWSLFWDTFLAEASLLSLAINFLDRQSHFSFVDVKLTVEWLVWRWWVQWDEGVVVKW